MQIKQKYECSLILATDLLGGKWKMRLLWHIAYGDNRFSKLSRAIPEISQKMLTTQLRELEHSGLIIRKVCEGSVPPRVDYEINEAYKELISILDEICDFTKDYASKNNIIIPE